MHVIGFGNPAREDDGIGPAVVAAVERAELEGVTFDANYQLTVEDAADVAGCDVVVFVDAFAANEDRTAKAGEGSFSFEPVEPKLRDSFSTHSVLPQDVLGMAWEFFGSRTKGYLLSVHGYSFRMFVEEMTGRAKENVGLAAKFLIELLERGDFTGGGSL